MNKVKIEILSKEDKERKGIANWPVWTKEVSRFNWFYDETEQCQILEGEVIIETDEGNFTIKAGDFVSFEKGLKCVWDIKKAIRKHYSFI